MCRRPTALCSEGREIFRVGPEAATLFCTRKEPSASSPELGSANPESGRRHCHPSCRSIPVPTVAVWCLLEGRGLRPPSPWVMCSPRVQDMDGGERACVRQVPQDRTADYGPRVLPQAEPKSRAQASLACPLLCASSPVLFCGEPPPPPSTGVIRLSW